jgi:hypothetical protein
MHVCTVIYVSGSTGQVEPWCYRSIAHEHSHAAPARAQQHMLKEVLLRDDPRLRNALENPGHWYRENVLEVMVQRQEDAYRINSSEDASNVVRIAPIVPGEEDHCPLVLDGVERMRAYRRQDALNRSRLMQDMLGRTFGSPQSSSSAAATAAAPRRDEPPLGDTDTEIMWDE